MLATDAMVFMPSCPTFSSSCTSLWGSPLNRRTMNRRNVGVDDERWLATNGGGYAGETCIGVSNVNLA